MCRPWKFRAEADFASGEEPVAETIMPPQLPSSFSIMSSMSAFSKMRTFRSFLTAERRCDVISRPVTSSWKRIRGTECAPSRVKARLPSASFSNCVPYDTRSEMTSLDERIMMSTLSFVFSQCPALIVSSKYES